MSISKHPPSNQGHYIKSPEEYLIEQNDPNLTHLYLHLAHMVNRSDEPKTVTLGGDRRPKVNVRLKKGQCAPSHSKLSEVSTIPESTVKRLLKRQGLCARLASLFVLLCWSETGGKKRNNTVPANHNPEHIVTVSGRESDGTDYS